MEIYRCPITVAEGGKQLEIPLLSTCTAVRGTYSTASRVEWEEEREEDLTFAMRTRQFSTPSPGSGIGDRSPKQIFSRYGIERAIREATRRKKRGEKGKKEKKGGGKK